MNYNQNAWAFKDIKYFEKVPQTRAHFKRACKRRNINFDDFEEKHVGYYYPPTGRRQKKYTYKLVK